jgi:chemotaxis protein CheD
MTATQMLVGMAEIHTLKGPGVFTCLGLGSCIGLCALDPVTNVAGMVHVMLPEMFKGRVEDKLGKFADTGVPALIKALESMGAQRSRLVLAMAGGAQVFKFGSGSGESKLDIGARNQTAVDAQIKALGLRCIGRDVGGNVGRTMTLFSDTGEVRVRTVSQAERVLCKLRG